MGLSKLLDSGISSLMKWSLRSVSLKTNLTSASI